MKKIFCPVLALVSVCCAQPNDKNAAPPAPAYVDEAPLPLEWPQPGPYDKVTEKTYPACRTAIAKGDGETLTFWALFTHLKRNNIPMTAPVEKSMVTADGKLRQQSMAFLYQSNKVGSLGPDGKKVEVSDIPAIKALSYTWQGIDSEANVAKAKAALDRELDARKAQAKNFRMLGYNGPGTPREKRTWELQAILSVN